MINRNRRSMFSAMLVAAVIGGSFAVGAMQPAMAAKHTKSKTHAKAKAKPKHKPKSKTSTKTVLDDDFFGAAKPKAPAKPAPKAPLKKPVAPPAPVVVKPVAPPSPVAPSSLADVDVTNLPRPAFSPSPVLIYRNVPQPDANADGITFWVDGDGKGGTIRIRAMASAGRSKLPTPLPGSGSDTEPLWPAWLSQPIPITFTGWKKFHFAPADLTYRPPVDAAPNATPAQFTDADTIGIDTNRRYGTIYVDDLAWGGNAADDAGTVVDDFEGNTFAWRRHGTREAMDSITYVRSNGVAKDGSQALKLDFTYRAQITQMSLAYLKRQLDVSQGPITVFSPKGPMEMETADALPLDGEATTEINTFACPEQTVSTSMLLYANQALTNVKVSQKIPLQIIGTRLPKSAVDIRVVKLQKEHGDGPLRDPDATTILPSLLVKDDRIPLAMSNGAPPAVRLTGDPVTDIPSHTQKQFWITVEVPAGTPAGKYNAQLEISADGIQPFTISLNVDVLGLRLMTPSKQYAVDFRGKLSGASSPETATINDGLTEDQFTTELKDIQAHGFRYTTLNDTGDMFWKAAKLYNDTNMGTPFIVENYGTIDDATALEAQRRKNRLDPFYYLAKNVDDLAALKAQRLQTAMKVTSADMLTKNASNIDLVLYAIDHPSVQALIASNGDRQLNNRDWFWWTASQSDAHLNRLYSGFLLWKCNVYGAMASDYQTAFGTDPFDDTLVPTGANAPYRPQMLTYPAQGGLISTIQWEGMREGVTDVRFLTTFFAAWRECKDNHLVPDLLKQYDADVRGFLAGPLQTLTEDELQQGRLMIATRAQKLRSTVDAYYVTHPLMGSVRPAPKPKP